MGKRKNHTNRNMTFKAHANGIKKEPNHFHKSLKGMDAKFLRNLKFSKKKNPKKSEEPSA